MFGAVWSRKCEILTSEEHLGSHFLADALNCGRPGAQGLARCSQTAHSSLLVTMAGLVTADCA